MTNGGTGGIGGLPPVPAGVCQPDSDDCAITHATTGWCLQASGLPVIVVTRWPCEPDDATPSVTMLDPSTGNTIPNQVVIPCDSRDFEINNLCDFDEITGELIKSVTQIFEWNETTGSLDVRLVAADDPNGDPYIVQGVLRNCHYPTWVDVESTIVCGNTAGTRRQLNELVIYDTRNSLVIGHIYLDANGVEVTPNVGEVFSVGDCWTEVLPSILDEMEEANSYLANLDAESNTHTTLLTDIKDNTTYQEALLTNGNVNTGIIASAVKNEDSVVGNADPGIPILARRNDSAITLTTADGDYTHISTDPAGRVGISDLGGSISVDDNGGSLTVDGTISVSNFPASFEVSNDVGNPLPISGTVTVIDGGGSLTVDGTVSVNGVTPGVSAVSLGKAEDAVHASGDVGVMALGVRNDAGVTRTSSDGDYSAFATDGAGRVGITTLGNTLPTNDAQLATTNNHLLNISGYTDGIEGLSTAILGRLSLSPLLPAGQVNVGTSAIQMHSSGQVLQQGVIVQAHPNNTGIVYIGNGSGVTTTNGFPLAAGASVTLPIGNTNQVYLVASAAGQVTAWIGV